MARSTWVLCGLVTLAACGGSPTGPTPTQTPAPQQAAAPVPPEPPAEQPVPAPAPPLPPQTPKNIYHAETGWQSRPDTVSGHFDVELFSDTMVFDKNWVPLVLKADNALLFRSSTMTVDMRRLSGETWSWTLNGLQGQASGSMTR